MSDLRAAIKEEIRRQLVAQRKSEAVEVTNLATGEKKIYSLTPERAVIAIVGRRIGT